MAKTYCYQIHVMKRVIYQEGGFLTRQDAVHAANIRRDKLRGSDVWEYVRKAGPKPPYLVAIGREEK